MFGFIQKMFTVTIGFAGMHVNALKCVLMSHQKCKVRQDMININNIEPLFYPCIILVNIPVEVVIILMIHMLNYAFLMLLKA